MNKRSKITLGVVKIILNISNILMEILIYVIK